MIGVTRDGILVAVSYAIYDDAVRLISARRATRYETRRYVNQMDELRDGADLEYYGDIDTRGVDWRKASVGPRFKIDRGPATVTLDDRSRLFFFGDLEVNGALRALIREGRIGPHFQEAVVEESAHDDVSSAGRDDVPDEDEDYGDIDTRNLDWSRMKVGPQFKIDRGPATVTLDDHVRLFFFGDVEVNNALHALLRAGRIGPHFVEKAPLVNAP